MNVSITGLEYDVSFPLLLAFALYGITCSVIVAVLCGITFIYALLYCKSLPDVLED